MNEHYWTLDTSLFEGTFKYFGEEPVLVRGLIHFEAERYSASDVNQEVTPISVRKGTRTYIHIRPFVLIPDVTLTIGLYRDMRPDGAIGEVVKAQERKMKEIEVGNVQAWSYPDGTLVLWEAFLETFTREQPLLQGANMAALWRSIESFLLRLCSRSTKIITPGHDPLFSQTEYESFLTSLGYAQVAKAAWGKNVARSEP